MRSVRRIERRELYKFIYNNGLCVYCGSKASVKDHFLPLAYYESVLDIFPVARFGHSLVRVEACKECNAIASSSVHSSLRVKLDYVHDRLRHKNRRLLEAADWTNPEIDELGHNLRHYCLNQRARKQCLQRRLQWRISDNPCYADIVGIRFHLLESGRSTAPPPVDAELGRQATLSSRAESTTS